MRTGIVIVIALLASFGSGILFEREIGIDGLFRQNAAEQRKPIERPPIPERLQPRSAALDVLTIPDGSIVFLGDSLIDFQEWNEVFPGRNIVNRGVAGATISDMTGRYDLRGAQAVFCLIGINDIGSGRSYEEFAKDYATLIESVPPNVSLFAISIPPVLRYGNKTIERKLIRKCNAFIRHAVKRRAKGEYVDIFGPLLKGSRGPQQESYYVSDGLHFNTRGYEVVADSIRPYLKTEPARRDSRQRVPS
jgi:lysophospholipase L1-like esterase